MKTNLINTTFNLIYIGGFLAVAIFTVNAIINY